MNAAQKKLVEVYGGGDFEYVTTKEEAKEVGDTLFAFLFIELSDEEGCEDLHQAVRRTQTALDDVEGVLHALQALEEEA